MLRIHVGTYTRGRSEGIYRLTMDPATGELSGPELAGEAVNPSFLAWGPGGACLYAVGEIADFAGRPSGSVSAFAVDPATGRLTLLNRQPSGGIGPCHLTVDASGSNLLAAHYVSGSVGVLPIGDDGRLAGPSHVVEHAGTGRDPKRQNRPHAHSVNLDAAGRFAYVADLGLDRVFVYRFDAAAGTLTPGDPPAAGVAPGAGPRHLAFGPGERFAYVINELNSTVTVFARDKAAGGLREVQTISTLPPGVPAIAEQTSTAEVAVHRSGRFLYGSNRGHDSIAIFTVDEGTGQLAPAGHQSTLGRTPRHFAIDPSGDWLVAANQDSDSLVVFGIDAETGGLTPTGSRAEVPSPVCVRFSAG